jgi:hypothetical protein
MTMASPTKRRGIRPNFRWLFSRASWRHWLEELHRFEEAIETTELDLLERRVRGLEAQVSELHKGEAAVTLTSSTSDFSVVFTLSDETVIQLGWMPAPRQPRATPVGIGGVLESKGQ